MPHLGFQVINLRHHDCALIVHDQMDFLDLGQTEPVTDAAEHELHDNSDRRHDPSDDCDDDRLTHLRAGPRADSVLLLGAGWSLSQLP